MRTRNPSLITKPSTRVKLVTLEDMLRRRRTTLKQFVTESGISTYELLAERCSRMGCTPPSREEFGSLKQNDVIVSSPTEGVVVVEPLAEDVGEEAVTQQEVEEEPSAFVVPPKARKVRNAGK